MRVVLRPPLVNGDCVQKCVHLMDTAKLADVRAWWVCHTRLWVGSRVAAGGVRGSPVGLSLGDSP